MSSEQPVGTSPLVTSSVRLTGRVKWFNNKAGYGFITVSDGANSGSDMFVHHSGIMVANEQYKYLVQGEYVSFKTDHTPSGTHECQAAEVSGINGGKLMCETRREFRQTRMSHNASTEDVEQVRPPRSTRPPKENAPAPRARGQGPRESEEWTMANQVQPQAQTQVQPQAKKRGRPTRANGTV